MRATSHCGGSQNGVSHNLFRLHMRFKTANFVFTLSMSNHISLRRNTVYILCEAVFSLIVGSSVLSAKVSEVVSGTSLHWQV